MRSSSQVCSCFLRASPRAAGSSWGSSPLRSRCEGSRTGPGLSSSRSRACIRRSASAGTLPTHPSDQQVDGQRTPLFRIQRLQHLYRALRPPDEPGHLRWEDGGPVVVAERFLDHQRKRGTRAERPSWVPRCSHTAREGWGGLSALASGDERAARRDHAYDGDDQGYDGQHSAASVSSG